MSSTEKLKVADLTGVQLDYWVAKAEGHQATLDGDVLSVMRAMQPGAVHFVDFAPSTSWRDGGPIIERERMVFWPKGDEGWLAHPDGGPKGAMKGDTHLIAAMRAYVASKFGEEVPIT